MPLECKACHKIFCQHCQLLLQKNPAIVQDEHLIEKLMEEDGDILDRSPAARKAQRMQWLGKKNDKSGRFNRDRYHHYKEQNNYEKMMCTNCKCKGESKSTQQSETASTSVSSLINAIRAPTVRFSGNLLESSKSMLNMMNAPSTVATFAISENSNT